MCLVTFIKGGHPDYPLIFLANRDEEYNRPTAPLHRWIDEPTVTGGMDLKEYGTWLGYTNNGRFIAVLNHPFTEWEPKASPRSRGQLLRDYLTSDISIEDFKTYLQEHRKDYHGFHLLFGTVDDLRYYSNVKDVFTTYDSGVHSLSNTMDDLSGHRKNRSTNLLEEYVKQTDALKLEELTAILADKQVAETMEDYPKVLDFQTAKTSSSIFIEGEDFGTVGSTAILLDHDGNISVREVKYNREEVTEITTKEQQLTI